MSMYQKIINSVQNPKQAFELRQALIKEIENETGRRLLVYVADINKPSSLVTPEDKTGFSDLIQGIEEKQIDILVNSPGGFAEVTESIVGMLRSRFDHIRFIIPNMAKSAATLLCLSGDELLMDHRSELGPIDPQVGYISSEGPKREAAQDIIDGFEEAREVLRNEGPSATPAYIPLLNKYTIALLRNSKNAMKLSKELAELWLTKYMFRDFPESKEPGEISDFLVNRSNTLSHNRAIVIDKCIELGLKVIDMRQGNNVPLAEKIWNLWCLYELHFERTPVHKIYENSSGCSMHKQQATIEIKVPVQQQPRSPIQHHKKS